MRKRAKQRLRAPLTRNTLQTWLKLNKPGYTTYKKNGAAKFVMQNGAVVANGRTWRELAAKVGMPT